MKKIIECANPVGIILFGAVALSISCTWLLSGCSEKPVIVYETGCVIMVECKHGCTIERRLSNRADVGNIALPCGCAFNVSYR